MFLSLLLSGLFNQSFLVVKIKKEIIQWLLRIFLIVLGLIIIYQLLKKLLGGSWEMQLLIALAVANLGYSFYLGNKVSEQKGWSAQFEKRFEALAHDFKGKHVQEKTPPKIIGAEEK